MRSKIEFLLNNTNFREIEEELMSHILNHICVLESGYLEQELQKTIDNYKASQHCQRHECKEQIKSNRKISNAKWCSIRPILSNIDNCIIEKLSILDNYEMMISSINNIVATRHKIAHGEDVTTLTLDSLENDFSVICNFIESINKIFEDICNDSAT